MDGYFAQFSGEDSKQDNPWKLVDALNLYEHLFHADVVGNTDVIYGALEDAGYYWNDSNGAWYATIEPKRT